MSRILIKANTIADHRGVIASPGAILYEDHSILAVGEPAAIGHIDEVQIAHIDGTVTPSFVNTHAHLDLSAVGPVDYEGDFANWLFETVAPLRKETSATEVEDTVLKGAALSLAGGCSIVGDIAGSLESAAAFQKSPLIGTSFVECFGIGNGEEEMISRMQHFPKECGISPHAPYSCGRNVYQAAFALDHLVSTHIAETLDEIKFTEEFTGDFIQLLKKTGAWNDEIVPWGIHPVEALIDIACGKPCIAAHCNYIQDEHIHSLASTCVTVAYCPRASRYFGHQEHRWKDMLKAGVNVSLGTDSLLCLDSSDRISVLDEMRLLYQHDNGDPQVLFAMGSVNGARALQLDPSLVQLDKGKCAGLLAFEGIDEDPLRGILESDAMPTWIGLQHKALN